MYTLILSPGARSQLAKQITRNGTFIHSLHACNGMICAMAYVVIEQCADTVSVRVELGDSVNSITLTQGAGISERVALFLEELARGGAPCSMQGGSEHLVVSDVESVLRDAVRLRNGSYVLPAEGVEQLGLLLHPSCSDPARTVFRFELDSVGLTLPLLLPSDQVLAYELLSGCVQELIANYRCAA